MELWVVAWLWKESFACFIFSQMVWLNTCTLERRYQLGTILGSNEIESLCTTSTFLLVVLWLRSLKKALP